MDACPCCFCGVTSVGLAFLLLLLLLLLAPAAAAAGAAARFFPLPVLLGGIFFLTAVSVGVV